MYVIHSYDYVRSHFSSPQSLNLEQKKDQKRERLHFVQWASDTSKHPEKDTFLIEHAILAVPALCKLTVEFFALHCPLFYYNHSSYLLFCIKCRVTTP